MSLGQDAIGESPIAGEMPNQFLPLKVTDPTLLVQALVTAGNETQAGRLIRSVTMTWRKLITLIEHDPVILYQLDPRKFEELVAGWYTEAGFDEVTLTPRSADHGRDVIAVKHGVGCVRFIDSVKRYGPKYPVPADDVRALIGVLMTDPKAMKGIVTTSSVFAPRIMDDPGIASLVPYRLELVDGAELVKRLSALTPKSWT